MTVIMEDTNTLISWPTRLKVGAKSKKDPHIKVAGRSDDVCTAKEKIMQILDIRQNVRVTMKLDVSYTDHSHIIGKGGLTIKRVMEETGCHIHFPDSNRSNHQEKSNQVSIAGEMENVEKARARVRNLTPLIFSFELPIMGSMQSPPDSTSPNIIKIQEKFNVQIMFRTRPKLHATLVVVKGCEWEVQKVKEATIFLINYFCRNLANQILVHMSMEISPQHHSIVLGKQSNNLRLIMQRTSTQIMFPDAGDPNIPNLKKSNVTITGSIDNVYIARQQLVGSLPLVLMFDLPEFSLETVETDNLNKMMQKYDVFINVRHKPKQNSLSVIIKGVERNATNIYETRRKLLNIVEPIVEAKIPSTCNLTNATKILQNTQISSANNSPNNNYNNNNNLFTKINTQSPPSSSYTISPLSPTQMGLSSPPWNYSSQMQQSLYSPLLNTTYAFNNQSNTAVFAAAARALQTNIINQQQQQQQQQQAINLATQNLLALNKQQQQQQNYKKHPPGFPPHPYHNTSLNLQQQNDNKDNHYLSLSSGASSTMSSPAISPRNISPICTSDHTSYKLYQFNDLATSLASIGLDKYIRTFTSHEIDMATFATLTEKDLNEIGINAWGARRRMLLLIAEINKRTKPFSGSAAPGAERKSSLTNCNSVEW
ncbi:protein bicaudal C [Aphidius gifuensis]|uniref:protein bicaudal C n=1 Tax=Aphidius gifuensis TaxID=684658 RepID=UPI001CDD75D0|nr:protein bicaudal C [Aphidius gifuensis]